MKDSPWDNLVIFIAILMFGGLVTFMIQGTKDNQTSAPSYPATINSTIGKPFSFSNNQYLVTKAEDLGSKLTYATTEGKFIFVTIEVKNNGTAETKINTIYLIDDKGRRYEEDFTATNMNSKTSPYGRYKNMTGIPAGFTETFGAIFEVSSDSENMKLVFPSQQGPAIASVSLEL